MEENTIVMKMMKARSLILQAKFHLIANPKAKNEPIIANITFQNMSHRTSTFLRNCSKRMTPMTWQT